MSDGPDDDTSPARKRSRSVREFRTCCHGLARHVISTFDEEKDIGELHFGLNRPRDRAADALGIALTSVSKLLRDGTQLLSPGGSEKRERGMCMDEEDASVIRPALVSLVLDKSAISLDTILARIKRDHSDWKWSRTTLYRALANRCGISFSARKNNYYKRLRENPANVQRRAQYLKHLFMYEAQNREFIFLDQTWMNKNMMATRCWTDGTVDCEPDAPPGKGARWIVIGAGGRSGWIRDSFVMWKGNIKSEDYHHEMDGEIFEDWFNRRLLPNVPPNACIILDRAPYHTLLTPESKGARTNWTREQIANWLVTHNAKDDDGQTLTPQMLLEDPRVPPKGSGGRASRGWPKQELYSLACELKPKPRYLFHEWVKSYNEAHGTNITALLLPVAHPILNPIEMMWGQIKRFVRSRNRPGDPEQSMETLKSLVLEKRDAQGGEQWQASFRHSWRYAIDQWKADEFILAEAEHNDAEEEDTSE